MTRVAVSVLQCYDAVGWTAGRASTEWWGTGMVICLERGADLHTAQLMPLPLTVSCFSKIQIGFTFLVPAYPGSPGQRAVMPLNVRRVLSSRRSDAGYKLLHVVSLLYCGSCASGVVQGGRVSLGHR